MPIKGLPSRVLAAGAMCAGAVAWLSGCSTTVFRHEPVWGSDRHVISMDAKQRAVLISKDKFCSEPSPDVFSVVAQALSFGGTFGRKADPKAVEAALQAAFSSAEQGSTIPRTQTINMLRELMFRTCERFLGGGYTEAELPIQAVRDQRLMVSILAIEQLTGVVVPKPVAISASASASQDGADALVRLDKAHTALRNAEAQVSAAKAAYDALEAKEPTCKSLNEKATKKETLDDAQSKKKTDCDKASADLAGAQKLESEARQHHSDLRKFATGIGGSASTRTEADAAGGLSQSTQITNVANIVSDIVTLNFKDGTEVMLFCLKKLGEIEKVRKAAGEPNASQATKDAATRLIELEANCLDHMKVLVAAQTSHVSAEKAESDARVQAATNQMLKTSNDIFDRIVARIESETDTPEKRIAFAAKVKELLPGHLANRAECFKSASDNQARRKCFTELTNSAQRAIAEGE